MVNRTCRFGILRYFRREAAKRISVFSCLAFLLAGPASAQSFCDGHKSIFSTVLQGTFADGPADAAYKPNQRCEWFISSPDPAKYPFISLTFLSKRTECGYDYIMIYDGDSYDSPLLATLSGGATSAESTPQILALSGKMLVYLFSDKNTEYSGFNASFTINECPNNCTGKGRCRNNKCDCDTSWTGMDCSIPACPDNCGGHEQGHCRTETELKKCNCYHGFIGRECRLNLNSDEDKEYWTVVYDYQSEPGSVGRAGHAAVYDGSYYYIFGGFDMNSTVAKLQRYNFEANEWLLLQSPTQPSSRFFHSMTAVLDDEEFTHFFLYGGDLGNDGLSDEAWIYNTMTKSWRMHVTSTTDDIVPALCQHTATLVKSIHNRFIYIFGGRNENCQDEGLSSDMYRFDWTNRQWQKVLYDPSGVKRSKLRVAGHSMVYDPLDETLILFGGFRMDLKHKAVYSSSVFLYSVKANRWAEIVASDQPGPFTYNIEPLAFHSANIIGDYMVVHGGNLYSQSNQPNRNNMCYSWKTHFYHLRSHAWVKELRRSSKPVSSGFFGHTAAIMNDAVLLVHGGYNGLMSGRLLAFKLPKLKATDSIKVAKVECAKNEDEASCSIDYLHGCVWTKYECKSGENELPVYGSVCEYLKDCHSCTTFSSYVRNSSYGWESSRCIWCVQDSTCYPQNGGRTMGACEVDSGIYKQNPWWDIGDIELLEDPESCLIQNDQPGIIAAEYHHSPNFSQPDNVSFLTEVKLALEEDDLFGDYLMAIRGFFRPNNLEGDFMKMQLLSAKGKSKIKLSLNDSPGGLQVVLKSSESSQPNIPDTSSLIDLGSFKSERCFIDISFNHSDSGHWTGNLEAGLATSYTKDSFKFTTLSAAHLEPFRSSPPSCGSLKNCMACLTDESCAWCEVHSVCISKSSFVDGSVSCASPDSFIGDPHFGIITEAGSCEICQDYSTCHECLTSPGYCEWRGSDKAKIKCVRRGSGGNNSISTPGHCPVDCHKRLDCESCLQGMNEYGISQQCAWCSTTQKCYQFTRYHLAAYPFGQCAFWVDEGKRCPVCSQHKSCKTCLETFECGWCSTVTNPLLGYCTKGGFQNTELNCDVDIVGVERNVDAKEMIWSYAKCPDINECVLEEWPVGNLLHSCHAEATCLNTDGHYLCVCNEGYEGDGQHCERTCLMECAHGRCSGPPDYACICDMGWTSLPNLTNEHGVECNVSCNCNFLSTCYSGPGICDSCQRNTSGPHCGACLPGYYRAGGIGNGCLPCQCNGHGIASLNFCDQDTGNCLCQHNTQGKHCQSCNSGYFGDPRDGGTCYRMCEGRVKLEGPSGAFGSRESSIREDGSFLRRELQNENKSVRICRVNCEWTVVDQNYTDNQGLIKITLEKDINIPCYTSSVLVYDGSFDSAEMTTLGRFCGSNWEKNTVVYARSGQATIKYTDVHLDKKQQEIGFTAKYDIEPYCPEIITQPDNNVASGQSAVTEAEMNLDVGDGKPSSTHDCLPLVSSGCFNGCSSDLEQGVCKNGLCQCHYNFTGFDCSKTLNEINSSVNLQLEWDERLSDGPNPGIRTGHVLIGLGSSLWLHGGISQNGKISDELWSYNTSERRWMLLGIPKPLPSQRYFHAAASRASKERFVIYGGVLIGGNCSSDIWSFSKGDFWQKQVTDRSLPQLAGHTMTFCGGTVAYIIGGYSSTQGFNENVWSFDDTSNEVSFIPKSVSHPPLFYGHSTVCDQDSETLYIFGGMEPSLPQLPSPTNAVYRLRTKTLVWQPIISSGPKHIVPLPRAFHAAAHFQSDLTKGIVVFGGQLASSQTSDEIWFLDQNCSTWKQLSSNVNDTSTTLVKGIPAYTSLASCGQSHYVYGGFHNGKFFSEMIMISNIRINSGRNVGTGGTCPKLVEPSCSDFKNCQNCVQGGTCVWCKSRVNPYKGKCILSNDLCGDDQNWILEGKHCDECLTVPPATCDMRFGCSWKYSEVMDKYHDKLLRSCFCHKDASFTDFDLTTASSRNGHVWPANPLICKDCSEECLGGCSTHKSCQTCLEFPDSYGVWWNCAWSSGLQRCMDPSHLPLACPPGANCGVLAGKGKVSCPVSRCKELASCWKCIHEAGCYWQQRDSSGVCIDVSVRDHSESHVVEWYYDCPLEDECTNHWHDCLEDDINREKCHDLRHGYECRCENGYDRESATVPCSPVCTQGCFHGKCVEPNTCKCNFGYTGDNCNTPCQCNGHSDCQDAQKPDVCLHCHNNTIGNQCGSCLPDYVGNPMKNISCEKCKDVCNGKSKICHSKTKSSASHGPTHDDVVCQDCGDNSRGERCEGCKEGYFKLNGDCRKCECNGHSDTCDEDTGGFCKCQNQTTSSDKRCSGTKNSQDSYPIDCWKKQCDQCKASYQGDPKRGGHCYRHVTIEQNMCFSSQSPTHCPALDYDAPSDNFLQHVLPAGQTVTFCLNPKFTNVDIRIIIDITYGELSLFLSDQPDAFQIITDTASNSHKVMPNIGTVRMARNKRDIYNAASQLVYWDEDMHESLQFDEVVRMQRSADTDVDQDIISKIRSDSSSNKLQLDVVNASDFNSFVTLTQNTALRVDGIRHRLVVTIPHTGFDLGSQKFYVILLGKHVVEPVIRKSSAISDHRNKRSVDGQNYRVINVTAGQLVFRQDLTHIDLFVFFSVFFSCFFLFLAICIVAWKIKQANDQREAMRDEHLKLQHMASRPFAEVYVILDGYIPERLFYSRKSNRLFHHQHTTVANVEATTKLFQARSCPVFNNPLDGDNVVETSFSMPNSPRCNSVKKDGEAAEILSEGAVDHFNLELSGSCCSSKRKLISPSKSPSEETIFSCGSSDQLLLVNGNTDVRGAEIPLLNSTTSYIRREPEKHLTPLSSCSSRRQNPLKTAHCFPLSKTGIRTIVSVDEHGRIRTYGKRKTLPPSLMEGGNSTDVIFEPRTEYYSAPNIPGASQHDALHDFALPPECTINHQQVGFSTVKTNVMKKLSHPRASAKTSTKSESAVRSGCTKSVKPLACEMLDNGFTTANTVLLQLPGGSKAPACFGTALVTTCNTGCTNLGEDSHVCKSKFKSNNFKLS